jgi:hypothetical protein
MLYVAMLVLHIFVACVTIVALCYTTYALGKGAEQHYKKLMIAIALLAVVETISGFLLAVLSPTATVESVAVHLVVYLAACLLAEAALVYKKSRVWIG